VQKPWNGNLLHQVSKISIFQVLYGKLVETATPRTGRPPKLDARAERRLVRFIASNSFKTLTYLSTPGKSGYRMHVNTTRKYLAKNEYYAFRPRRKPYLIEAYKKERLRWTRIYKN
jgi:Transposase